MYAPVVGSGVMEYLGTSGRITEAHAVRQRYAGYPEYPYRSRIRCGSIGPGAEVFITPLPTTGAYMRANDPAPSGVAPAPGRSAGSHTFPVGSHARHGNACTASARNRLGRAHDRDHVLFVGVVFARHPAQPALVPTLSGSQVCQMSMERKCERGELV